MKPENKLDERTILIVENERINFSIHDIHLQPQQDKSTQLKLIKEEKRNRNEEIMNKV